MPKAEIILKDGTNITIDGTVEEVAKIVSLYKSNGMNNANPRKPAANKNSSRKENKDDEHIQEIDLAAMANRIRDCGEAEILEMKILDHPDVVNRILMCLYINKTYFDHQPPMTTGEISKLLKQLGVPISTANVSTAISRKAKALVMADGVRKKGSIVRYELNRRGIQQFEELIGSQRHA